MLGTQKKAESAPVQKFASGVAEVRVTVQVHTLVRCQVGGNVGTDLEQQAPNKHAQKRVHEERHPLHGDHKEKVPHNAHHGRIAWGGLRRRGPPHVGENAPREGRRDNAGGCDEHEEIPARWASWGEKQTMSDE